MNQFKINLTTIPLILWRSSGFLTPYTVFGLSYTLNVLLVSHIFFNNTIDARILEMLAPFKLWYE
jgi:hypothetical protein